MTTSLQRTITALTLLAASVFTAGTALAETTVTYLINDGLGSPIAAMNEQGAVVWRKDYQPYGSEYSQDPAATEEHIGYTGHVHDNSTGLTYMGARYYDPTIGRFMAADPVGFDESNPMSFSRYGYANSNPYRYVDPDGRAIETPIDVISLGLSLAIFNAEPTFFNGLGVAYDGFALAVPFLPAGFGIIKSSVKVADGVGVVAKSGPKLLASPRQHLLDSAADPKLRNRIDKLYRANAKVGNGSTADAIRHELKTGELLSPKGHFQKGIEMRNGLMKDIKSGRLNAGDTTIARGLVKDLQNALSGQ